MRFYISTFIVASIVVMLALAVAFAPEIRHFLQRFRRPQHTVRHRVRRVETGPRPPRPKLRREKPRNETAPDEESPPA